MKSFSYIAQDAKNKQVKGVINAENEQEFLKKIKEKVKRVELMARILKEIQRI